MNNRETREIPRSSMKRNVTEISYYHLSIVNFSYKFNTTSVWRKDVSFLRNCGAASVGEYSRAIECYQLSWKRKLAAVNNFKADISSVSPSPDRLEELWIVRGFKCRKESHAIGGNMMTRKQEYIS